MNKVRIILLMIVVLIPVISATFLIKGKIFSEIMKTDILAVSNEGALMDLAEREKDKQMIRKAVEDVFDAYNSTDDARITSVLHQYINPDQCRLVLIHIPDYANSINVNGNVIYKDGIDFRNNRFTLGDNDIFTTSPDPLLTGYMNGYADGSVSIPDKKVEKGPWKIFCSLYKIGDKWFIEYLILEKFDMIKLEYYTQLPKDYGKEPDKKWPLIVFMHGAGERGGTLDDVKKINHSIPMVASTAKDFPFIAVSPLCPSLYPWKNLPYSISNMIDELSAKYNIDEDRIYLTGLSLGGIGTWSIALQFPDMFAAIAPVCGSVDPDKVEKLKNLPIWAFHGAKDTIVPMDEEQKAVDVLKACGGNIRYTVYPDVEHDAWNKAYPNMELYDWFLQHSRMKNK